MRLAILSKQFKVAEGLLLEHGLIDQALDMYQQLYKWDEAIAVAEASVSLSSYCRVLVTVSICDRICKKGLIHASNFSHNLA